MADMPMVDLHTHSTASDGSCTPAALMRKAKRAGLGAIALTDHDTIAGLDEAREEAGTLGLTLIPGIELEIAAEEVPGEFHLLGLGISEPSASFRALLDELADLRVRRNVKIVGAMREAGIDADLAAVAELAGGAVVARPHFAAYLVRKRCAKNVEAAFDKYLGKGKPFYVPKGGASFARAAGLIHESGGLAVLAHPLSLHLAWGKLPDYLAGLNTQGLDGIEAWHSAATVHKCKRLDELARRLGLKVSAGSDFHGTLRRDRKLGYSAGGKRIPDTILEQLIRS
jgi:predicted metal-dependent phosphoesterase TrpH